MSKADQVEQETRPTRAQRLRRRLGAAVAWIIAHRAIAVGLGSVCAVAIGFFVFIGQGEGKTQVTFQEALEAYDQRQFDLAEEKADLMLEQANLPPEEVGGPLFVLGAAASRRAADLYAEDRRTQYLKAARYLEEARDYGFPEGRDAEGLYLLGRSLFATGSEQQSRTFLQESLKLDKRRRTEILQLLAAAEVAAANPNWEKALALNTDVLADPGLRQQDREDAWLQRSQILLRLGDVDQCRETLVKIAGNSRLSGDALVMMGRLSMREAQELQRSAEGVADPAQEAAANAKYLEAIETFRQAQDRERFQLHVGRHATFLIGLCFVGMSDYRAAREQFRRTQNDYFDSPEAFAAMLYEADILRRHGEDEQAVDAYQAALNSAGDPASYSNPWIPLDDFHRRLLEAFDYYLTQNQFDNSFRLVRFMRPMFSLAQTTQLEARIHREWGRSLLLQAEQETSADRDGLRKEGRRQMRTAGWKFHQLARMRVVTRQYPDDVWDAAEAYLAGQEYRKTIRLLTHYLETESTRRRPRALLMLGKSYLALGRVEQATVILQEGMQSFPDDAAIYESRLLLAQAYQETDKFEEAERLLLANLDGEALTPVSKEWRLSKFALGRLLHDTKRYEEAIPHLDEAIIRYPEDPRSLEARFLMAECYRHSGKVIKARVAQATAESARRAQLRDLAQIYGEALDLYTKLRQDLIRQQAVTELTDLEESVLRNSYFARGEILFELGRYTEAIDALSSVTNRYQQAPEVLEAYVQIANCYRRLHKPDNARDAIDQAKVVLERINPDAPFARTTIFTRQEWIERLDWLASL